MDEDTNRIIRIYNEEGNDDDIFIDIYELILSKLDSELLVKDT
jgi:hypothetical protein